MVNIKTSQCGFGGVPVQIGKSGFVVTWPSEVASRNCHALIDDIVEALEELRSIAPNEVADAAKVLGVARVLPADVSQQLRECGGEVRGSTGGRAARIIQLPNPYEHEGKSTEKGA